MKLSTGKEVALHEPKGSVLFRILAAQGNEAETVKAMLEGSVENFNADDYTMAELLELTKEVRKFVTKAEELADPLSETASS